MVGLDNPTGRCEPAWADAARILMEPTDFAYGERQYEAEDLAGHRWTFFETLKDLAAPEGSGGASQDASGA
jgi:uncharacterized glyoxalase superfamily protein PhnB